MSITADGRRNDAAGPGRDSPVADWLVALSHDSPFEGPPPRPSGGHASPPLATVPLLLSLLNDADREVRLSAVAAVGNLVEEIRQVLPGLRTALGQIAVHDGDDHVRAEAVRALLRAGPQPATAVGPLTDALDSEIDLVRFHAAIALGDFGPEGRPAVADLIHASLWDADPAVRLAAAMALWKIDDRRPLVVHVLADALADPNELICWVAAEWLGQIGPAAGGAAPALRQALRRDFRLRLVRTAVGLALERVESPPSRAAG